MSVEPQAPEVRRDDATEQSPETPTGGRLDASLGDVDGAIEDSGISDGGTPDGAMVDAGGPSPVRVVLSGSAELAGDVTLVVDGTRIVLTGATTDGELPSGAVGPFEVTVDGVPDDYRCEVKTSSVATVAELTGLEVRCEPIVRLRVLLQDFATGAVIEGAEIRWSHDSRDFAATADAVGRAELRLPRSESLLVSLRHPDYAPQVKVLRPAHYASPLAASWAMHRAHSGAEFDPASGVIQGMPRSALRVAMPGQSLVDGHGNAASDAARLVVAPIDPSAGPEELPGLYRGDLLDGTSDVPLQVLAGLDVRAKGASGGELGLVPGQSFEVAIPATGRAVESTPPDTASLFELDPNSGHYRETTPASLRKTGWGSVYEATASSLGSLIVARPLPAIDYSSCVVDGDGAPVAGAVVHSVGYGFANRVTVTTDDQGRFTVPLPENAYASIHVAHPQRSRTLDVTTADAAIDQTACLVMASGEADVRATLAWGPDPRVDLYFYAVGFRIGPVNKSWYVGSSRVTYDMSDVSSFGPEVISSGPLRKGHYRFAVHQDSSGSPTMGASPVRLRLQAPLEERVFVPSARVSTSRRVDMWVAVDLDVAEDGTLTVLPVDVFVPDGSVDYRCPDMSAADAFGCGGASYACADGALLPGAAYCDDFIDCADGSDENNVDCPDNVFVCADGHQIERRDYCDNTVECPDGSDENNADCPNNVFQCDDGTYTRASYVCDEDPDCVDGSDENRAECPGSVFQCDDGSFVRGSYVCNGSKNCADLSDEAQPQCADNVFACGDGSYILASDYCDERADCSDGSDENTVDCPSSIFQCADGSSIRGSWECDEWFDCADGDDENTANCPNSMFLCKDGFYVGASKICDGVTQCMDGDDEIGQAACPENSFTCNDGTQIFINDYCDGAPDCPDVSDENVPGDCPNTLFACAGGGYVPLSWICDGWDDCGDNSDELNCP